LSDTAISPAAKFEFDRAMKKIPEPAAAPPAAPAAPPPADNSPAVPPTARRGSDWYETYRDNLSQKAQKLRQSINTDGFSNPTAEELAGYPSARLIEERLLKNKEYDLLRFVRNPDQNLNQVYFDDDNIFERRRDATRAATGSLPSIPALAGGLAIMPQYPVAGAQFAAGAVSNIARNTYNMPTYLSPSKLKPTPQEIQKLLNERMQARLAENDRYDALEKFVEYPDQTQLKKLRELRAKHLIPEDKLPVYHIGAGGLSPVPNTDRRGPGHRTPDMKDSLPPTDQPDGIPISQYPFLDNKVANKDNRAQLTFDEFDAMRAATPHLPPTEKNRYGRPYIHPDALYSQKSNPDRVSGYEYVPAVYSEQFYNSILEKHKDGDYPTRAERERAKQKEEETFKIHFPELADPNTHLGSSQRLRRMVYDPTDEGINPDVIPLDVLRRNDPAEIRYHAQKAKMMQGR
jgi:hypothetical protein